MAELEETVRRSQLLAARAEQARDQAREQVRSKARPEEAFSVRVFQLLLYLLRTFCIVSKVVFSHTPTLSYIDSFLTILFKRGCFAVGAGGCREGPTEGCAAERLAWRSEW